MRASSRRVRRLGSLVGIGGLVWAVVWGVITYWLPRSAPPSAEHLQVVGLQVSRLADITWSPNPDVGASPDVPSRKLQDSVIDVRLQNTGGSPVLLTAVKATVVSGHNFVTCPLMGGALEFSGQFDIRVLTSSHFPAEFRAEKPIQIAPNSFDRISVSIGPLDSDVPWVYTADLTAETSVKGTSVRIGRVTVVNPASSLGPFRAQPFSTNPETAQCIHENAAMLNAAVAEKGVVADEVVDIQKRYGDAVAALDQGTTLSSESGKYGLAGTVLVDCSKAGLKTTLLSEDYGDVTDDGIPDVILTQQCRTGAAVTPDIVQVFDGRSSAEAPILLGTVLTASDGLDPSGVQVIDASAGGGQLVVHSWLYRLGDPDPVPILRVTDVFKWNGYSMNRVGQRECVDTAGHPGCEP